MDVEKDKNRKLLASVKTDYEAAVQEIQVQPSQVCHVHLGHVTTTFGMCTVGMSLASGFVHTHVLCSCCQTMSAAECNVVVGFVSIRRFEALCATLLTCSKQLCVAAHTAKLL